MNSSVKELSLLDSLPDQIGRLGFDEAFHLSSAGLITEGSKFPDWLVGFSGGKDSTAVVCLIQHLIDQGIIHTPSRLIVNNNDTLMELPPLQQHTDRVLEFLKGNGWEVYKSIPKLVYKTKKGALTSGRFFVQLLGCGYPPPNSTFTWCRQRMKLDAVQHLFSTIDIDTKTTLTIDGVRIGESVVRDKAIYASCRKDDGECGSTLLRDVPSGLKLSPIAHWRVCHVFDWLVQCEIEYGYPVWQALEVYGMDKSDGVEDLSARTGCMGCPLVTASNKSAPRPDKALLRVLKIPQWSHLEPLLKLGEIYWKLHFDYSNRHIWDSNVKGNPKRHGRPGCLTIEARKCALDEILKIEDEINKLARFHKRSPFVLIREEEKDLITMLQKDKYFTERWNEDDITGNDILPAFQDPNAWFYQASLLETIGV